MRDVRAWALKYAFRFSCQSVAATSVVLRRFAACPRSVRRERREQSPGASHPVIEIAQITIPNGNDPTRGAEGSQKFL